MPDALAAALATPGLGWLVLAALVAGMVRGFAGFGAGLVFVPVAAQVLPPLWALITISAMDLLGPIPNIPAALRRADRGDLLRLVGATLLALPLGLAALSMVAPEMFRTTVSLLSLGMLGCLVGGLRYRGPLGPRMVLGTGGAAGFLGGLAALPGPPVILLYMASPNPVAVVRASIMAYLFFFDIALMGVLAVQDALVLVPVLLGLALALPNLAGNLLGAAIFRPGFERIYRAVAYSIIAVSALSGLPLWE
ncbi:TSUP family transporter [Antarcticimicrobium luteum]|uniref:Probable membrane transporter protein n=1 Tax=Antarcticimicrobium luteum TaxID=2547397 RepID=A0A4R5VF62_9RHOB|nr:TSUP family transporter [Antarcticimicrobium luteum]TDK50463.1 sulfite exporter TauE/SafE family protein [Antarcticimicrobium luteum]